MRALLKLALAATLVMAGPACSQTPPVNAPADGGEDPGALSAAGAFQGNWRVTRLDDQNDAALMALQLRHDGDLLEGEYVLHQPFCGVDQTLPLPANLDCEFTDLSASFDDGTARNAEARLILRPGADGADHRLVFPLPVGDVPANGAYFAPGEETPVRIRVTRMPDL